MYTRKESEQQQKKKERKIFVNGKAAARISIEMYKRHFGLKRKVVYCS